MRLKSVLAVILMFVAASAFAQVSPSAAGTLTATATVQGAVQLVFNPNTSGPAFTSGAGTSIAQFDFGTIAAYGVTPKTGVTQTNAASSFTVSAPFDVTVSGANVNTTYNLTASVNDTAHTWAIGTTTLGTTATSVNGGSAAFGTSTLTLKLTVPFSAAAGSISQPISFTATAN